MDDRVEFELLVEGMGALGMSNDHIAEVRGAKQIETLGPETWLGSLVVTLCAIGVPRGQCRYVDWPNRIPESGRRKPNRQ